MKSFGRKRKWGAPEDIGSLGQRAHSCDDGASTSSSAAPIAPNTFGGCIQRMKRHKEKVNNVASPYLHLTAAVTVPLSSRGGFLRYVSKRGLKRNAGCIEEATQTGRKAKIDSVYLMGQDLGRGKFGVVRLCKKKATGEHMACKTIPKNGLESAHNEVQIMQHLSGHPNVITLHAVYEDADDLHLVMDFCSGGRLVDFLRKNNTLQSGCCSERKAAKLIRELVTVIKYCHEMGVVHRDIKPENILLSSDGQLKLSDFGLSLHVAKGQKLSGLVGSPAYVAPETFSGTYTEKVDVWAAGVILHALLVGTLPFRGDCAEAIFEAIKKYVQLDFQTEMWKSVSGPAKDLLSRMLSRDVGKRLSAVDVLSHPWILFYTDSDIRINKNKYLVKHDGHKPSVTACSSYRLDRKQEDDSFSRQLQRLMYHKNCDTKTEKKFGSPFKCDGHKESAIAGASCETNRKQEKAALARGGASEDEVNSISRYLQRVLHVDTADCTYPSFPEEQDLGIQGEGGCDLIDVLSAAISQMTISRPKKSRVQMPAYTPPPGCSPNLHMTLCKAF